MSDHEEDDARTEEPTEKKLADAIEAGDVPISPDISAFANLLAAFIVASQILPAAAQRLAGNLALFVDDSTGWRIAISADGWRVAVQSIGSGALFIFPIVLIFGGTGIVAAFAQTPPRLIPERIAPKFSRISVSSGLARLRTNNAPASLAKGFLKIAAVGASSAIVLTIHRNQVLDSLYFDVANLPTRLMSVVNDLFAYNVVALGIVAVVDLVWVRTAWRRRQRMTRRELREEIEQAEGDPFLKARFRSIRAMRRRKRMLAAVPRATMVIANPTHYAVALRYDESVDDAPRVIAKGIDKVAIKIREAAERHNVPVFEDKALARSLYESVSVDSVIPPAFYKAIALIISRLRANSARRASARLGGAP